MELPPKIYCEKRGPPKSTNITRQSSGANEETRETFDLNVPYQYMDDDNENY